MEDKDKLIAELKTENARLKEEIIHQRKLNQELIIKYVKPFAVPTLNTELFDKNYKLSQTLREIKAISEKFIKNVSENCVNITPMFLVHKEILQLITKAESEE